VIETVTEQGLNRNHTYRHVDVNLSGWGPPNPGERGEDAAHRKTVDESGINVKDLLEQGMMREVTYAFNTWIYAPTNKLYYKGIDSHLNVRRKLCAEYLSSQEEDQVEKVLKAPNTSE